MDRIEFHRRKAVIACQHEWFHPVLANFALPLDMNMLGFVAIKAEEVQALRAGDSANCWHGGIIDDDEENNKRLARRDSDLGPIRREINWTYWCLGDPHLLMHW